MDIITLAALVFLALAFFFFFFTGIGVFLGIIGGILKAIFTLIENIFIAIGYIIKYAFLIITFPFRIIFKK